MMTPEQEKSSIEFYKAVSINAAKSYRELKLLSDYTLLQMAKHIVELRQELSGGRGQNPFKIARSFKRIAKASLGENGIEYLEELELNLDE